MKVWTSVTTPTPAWHGGDVVQPVGHLSATLKASAKLVCDITGNTGGATLYGSTQPGVPEETPSTRTNLVRCYNIGDLSSTNPGDAVALASTAYIRQGTRFDDLRGATTPQAQTQAVNDMAAYWGNLRDEVDQYADPWHEPDNGDPVTGAQIIAAMDVIIARVKPIVNQGRTHKVKFGNTFTGGFFASGTAASIDAWIGSGWDWLGADIYYSIATATNGAAAATRNGIPVWLHPEVGTQVKTNPPDTGVGSHLEHMKALVAKWETMSFPPRGVAWFEQNHNRLWTRLSSAASAGDASIVVKGIPGKASSPPQVTDWSMANGATIIIDPHGANPETRSLTSLVQHAGDTATTLPFAGSPLAHAHSANAVVWLMPSSIAYWRNRS